MQDPCVFNSVIKYEVVPAVRAPEYTEDDYLCLKPTFNVTLERYMSVTRQVMNDTCKDGKYLQCVHIWLFSDNCQVNSLRPKQV